MNKYRYNELEYAEAIEKDGFRTKFHPFELKILVKYYKHLGCKPKERRERLVQFCMSKIKSYNEVLYYKSINTALNFGTKKYNVLIVVNDVSITKNEIEYINNLDIDIIHKKIVFTLMVQKKINNIISKLINKKKTDYVENLYFGGKRQQYKDIFENSMIPQYSKVKNENGISKSVKNNIDKIIHNLGLADVITLADRGKIILSFIDRIEQCDEIAIRINTYDNIGLYFDKYIGDDRVVNCECGSLIRVTNNKKKYCHDCAKRINNEKSKENMKEKRSV